VRRGLKYRIFGGVRFYERREIKDVLAYMRAIHNPHDDVCIKRIINVPRRGIGAVAVDFFEKAAIQNDIKFFDTLKRAEEFSQNTSRNKKINEFVGIIDGLKKAAEILPLGELVKLVLEKTGYQNSIMAEDDAEGTDRMSNISELVNNATAFENHESPTLATFLEEVALVADIDDLSENDDAVALMTLHSSKGLEFDNVFLPGLEEGIFPTYRAITSGERKDMEEERRLAYVGITRARKQVHILAAGRRMHNGETTYLSPSRFIKEIPEELLEITEENGGRRGYENGLPRQSFVKQESDTAVKHLTSKSDITMESNFGKKWDISKIRNKGSQGG